jgi:hypothetical protein
MISRNGPIATVSCTVLPRLWFGYGAAERQDERLRIKLVHVARQADWAQQKNPRRPVRDWRGFLKNSRRYLLSRFGHYHRLRKLNGRVRNGNGCDLSDNVTGRSAAGLFAPRRSCFLAIWRCNRDTASPVKGPASLGTWCIPTATCRLDLPQLPH